MGGDPCGCPFFSVLPLFACEMRDDSFLHLALAIQASQGEGEGFVCDQEMRSSSLRESL